MRLIALGVASAIATILTAKWRLPTSPIPLRPSHRPSMARLPLCLPKWLSFPGEPVVVPRYNGSSAPAVVVGSSPYGEAPPVVSPGFRPGTSLPPRAACEPVWRCDNSGCGWGPSCPHPEPYANPYRSPAPPVYSQVPPAPESYASPYGAASPNGAPVCRSTLALEPRRLRSPTLARTHHKALARTRHKALARTHHSSTPDHRAQCAGSSVRNHTAFNRPNVRESGDTRDGGSCDEDWVCASGDGSSLGGVAGRCWKHGRR
jgi:hypothetical protein